MSTRCCAECAAPLGPTDEVCLLGHLAPEQKVSDLTELRAKVNAAFAAAESHLQLLTAEIPVVDQPVAIPVQPPETPSTEVGIASAVAASAADTVPTVPARPVTAVPPPPPPPSQLFTPLPEAAADRSDDPITAFAPAARLDWGPEKTRPSLASGFLKRFNR